MRNSKILHIIPDLGPGGAQKYLSKLVSEDNENIHLIYVINPEKYIEKDLKNVEIIFSKKNLIFFPFMHILELNFLIKKIKPNVVNSWLYHADFLSIFINPFYKCKKIWCIRNAVNDMSFLKKKTRIIIKLCSFFSKIIPNLIIYNSESGRRSHESINYCKSKSYVIENGVDVNFQEQEKRVLNKEIYRIGTACRNDPAKGLNFLIEALNHLDFNDWHWTAVGEGIPELNVNLDPSKFELIGHIDDIYSFYNNIDLFVLPSISEGFSNVLLESMAQGIDCIATNVGDNLKIVGPNNFIVPSRNPLEIKKAISKKYDLWIRKKRHSYNIKNAIYVADNFGFKKSFMLFQNAWKH